MAIEPVAVQADNPFVDVNSFEAAYQRYREGIYFTAYRVCQNEADAQEVVSETFLKAYEHRGQFEGRSTLGTWLYRIAYHVSLDILKRKKREVNWTDDYEAWPDAGSPLDDLVENMATQQQVQRLRQAMTRLHPEDRVILGLRFDRELSYEEIAVVTGIPANTVGTRIYRAKRLLFRLMKSGGED